MNRGHESLPRNLELRPPCSTLCVEMKEDGARRCAAIPSDLLKSTTVVHPIGPG